MSLFQSGTLGQPTNASLGQGQSSFGPGNNTQTQPGSSLFGNSTAANTQNSLFGNSTNNALGASTSTQQQQQQPPQQQPLSSQGNSAAVSQPAFFSSLLERGKKRPHATASNASLSELPSLQVGIEGLRSLARGISKADNDTTELRITEKKGVSSLAASGVHPSSVRQKLASLDAQAAATGVSKQTELFDPDNQKFLRNVQQRGREAIIADSLARVRDDFNVFLEEKVALNWEEQRQRIYEHFGIGSSKPETVKGAFGRTTVDAKAVSSGDARRSVFGRSAFEKSVIGTPATDPTDLQLFGNSVRKDLPATLDVRYVREKMRRFATTVRSLNEARLQAKTFPILHEFLNVEKGSADSPRDMSDAYEVLISIVGEDPNNNHSSPRQRQYMNDYLDDNSVSDSSCRMRQRIIDGSRRFLEQRFRKELEELVAKNPKEAQIGGVPSVINKVRAYVRLRAARKDLAPDATELQMVGQDYCWVLLFYLLRCGFVAEAADYVGQNIGFRSLDHKFVTYMTTYAREKRLPRELQQKINAEYQQRLRNAPEIDPYRMACYKIIGRSDPTHRRFDGIAQGVEDWMWLQFVFAREDHRSEELATEAFGLEDVRKDFLDIGQRVFADNAGSYALYFLLQMLGGMFEHAISYLGRYDPVSAVHFAIALSYYGLLRASNFYISGDILSFTTKDQPQINFAYLITHYTRDFRTGDAEAAVDYFTLLCLNSDLTGEAGRSQVAVCHEALREFVLESREFAKLLGDIRPDGTRIKGAIEQRLKLIGIDDKEQFLRTITIQAAAIADDKGLITDAARLYHLAEEYDKVIALINRSLSDAIALDLAGGPTLIAQGEGGHAESGVHNATFDLAHAAEPLKVASTMVDLYDSNPMYYNKIQPDNRKACKLLLQAMEARTKMEATFWTQALDDINALQILPLTARGSVAHIRGAAQAFSSLPPVLSRIVGQLIMWSIHCIARERERLQQGLFENDMRHNLSEQLLSMAKDLMVFAGMIRYRLSPRVYQTLACTAGEIGL